MYPTQKLASSISFLLLPIYMAHFFACSASSNQRHLLTHTGTENGSIPHVVEDIYGVLLVYSNGLIFRAKNISFNIPVHEDASVVWKDCLYDKKHKLYLRLYKPVSKPKPCTKLPIVYFFHGGGFCIASFAWPNDHNCGLRLSSGLQALVVAPDYRLAPEHRLPAAIDDALTSLKWLRTQALSKSPDTWLHDEVDFDRVYIVGDSSGGNIAHHLAVQLGRRSRKLAPVRVRGYVLISPFFGGTVRTKSELGPPEPILNLELLDSLWRLSLPVGQDQDCPLANPFGPRSKCLKKIKLDPILVIAGSRELLRDRAKEYARTLQQLGKKVFYVEFEGERHGFFLADPYSKKGSTVLHEIQHFMPRISG